MWFLEIPLDWLPSASYGLPTDPETKDHVATANLTKRVLDTVQFSPGCDYFIWDTRLKRFGVRVTERTDANGVVQRRRVFVIGYRTRKSRQFRRFSLGPYGPLTVEQAREEALKRLAAVFNGADPVAHDREERARATMRELSDEYLREVEQRRRPSTATEYRRMWDRHVLPALGSKKVAEVDGADIRRLHRTLRETPYYANRVVAMLGAFFTFAAKEQARSMRDNPAHGIEFYPEIPRERFLSPEEFQRLGAALTRAETTGLPPAPEHRRKPPKKENAKHTPKSAHELIRANRFAVAAIRLLALTGCRESEVRTLRWDAVDLKRGHLRLADTKTGRSVRPLGQSAAAILSSLPRVSGNPHVLPGSEPGQPLKEIRRLWHAVRHAAKLEGLRLHDLRHSFASVPANGGESLLVVRSLLGHKRSSTTERYAHLGDDPVRKAADTTAQSIANWLGGTALSAQPPRPVRSHDRRTVARSPRRRRR